MALVEADGEGDTIIWLHGEKVTQDVRSHLEDGGVEIRQIFSYIKKVNPHVHNFFFQRVR